MPGTSIKDFKVGQWVGINKKRYPAQGSWEQYLPVMKITELGKGGGRMVSVEEYRYDMPGEPGLFEVEGLYTAEETEEILYHCSYCGTEGHNRRTCPNLGLDHVVDSGEYFIGGITEYPDRDIPVGTKFSVTRLRDSLDKNYEGVIYERVANTEYVRGKVISATGPGGAGKEWNFGKEKGKWNFHIVFERTPKEKPLSLWELVEKVLPASRLTLLYGPPGTGKTTIANSFGTPNFVSNITLTEETPAAELRGHFIPKGGEFVWMDGPALTEFSRGGRLVLNEIDKASGDALTFCHALLDDPGIARITLPYKDDDGHPVTLKPHPDFHVVATMNGEPEDLPEALRDRFAVRIHVDKVHPNAIKALPKDLQKIASKGVSNDGDRSVSIRGWNAFVQLRELIGEANAAQAVFGPRATTILNTIKIDSIAAKSKEKK